MPSATLSIGRPTNALSGRPPQCDGAGEARGVARARVPELSTMRVHRILHTTRCSPTASAPRGLGGGRDATHKPLIGAGPHPGPGAVHDRGGAHLAAHLDPTTCMFACTSVATGLGLRVTIGGYGIRAILLCSCLPNAMSSL